MMLSSLGPDDGGQEDGEGERRQGEPGVGDAHHHLVGPAAEIARHDAQQGADAARHQHGGDADHHGDARAEDQAREHVAADMVCPQRIGEAAAFSQNGGLKRRARLPICGSCGASTSANTATKAMNTRIDTGSPEAFQSPERRGCGDGVGCDGGDDSHGRQLSRRMRGSIRA